MTNDLKLLNGEELSGVGFIRTYVELYFDGPILRAIAAPRITLEGGDFQFPTEGSRDVLCSLIGRPVLAATDDSQAISVRFPGAEILIPRADADAGPEIAHLVPVDEGKPAPELMFIWENQVPSD